MSTRDPNHNSLAETLCRTLELNTLYAITGEVRDQGTPPVASLQLASGDDKANAILDPASLPKSESNRGPLAKVAIRMIDGSREVIEIGINSTLKELGDKIIFISKPKITTSFRLLTGIPTMPLSDMNQTIEDAKLKNSMVLIEPISDK